MDHGNPLDPSDPGKPLERNVLTARHEHNKIAFLGNLKDQRLDGLFNRHADSLRSKQCALFKVVIFCHLKWDVLFFEKPDGPRQ
jgi:hypothetical protein